MAFERLDDLHETVVLVEARCVDQKLSEALLSCAKHGVEVRILTLESLTRIKCRMEAPVPLTDRELVTGREVGTRVSEKIRSTLGSIRLGSEILLSKVRNPRGSVLSDVEAIHEEIVEFCESIGFYLDLRVPGGQVSGGWMEYDAFEELGAALSRASAKSACTIHLSGHPGVVVSGFKRDQTRLVFELVQNSIVHGYAKNVWLAFASDALSGEAVLTIEDDGQGFMYREAAEGGFCLRMGENELRSKGIGILICRRILSRYRGRIDYLVKRDGGIRVEVRVQTNLKKPDSSSILAPIELRVEE